MKATNLKSCKNHWCAKPLTGKRPDALYCSPECYNRRKRFAGATERTCRREGCRTIFPLKDVSDRNRRYCSETCAKIASKKLVGQWHNLQPESYNHDRYLKQIETQPTVSRDKHERNRAEAIRLLGGQCVVSGCGVTNRYWLHIDFIPTGRGTPYRHSRGIAYLRSHLDLFRLLCANHHYELTLTGEIEGTNITQRCKEAA